MVTFSMHRDFYILFVGVSVQINAVSSTFSVTDHKHVLLIRCDIFTSMFPVSNNIWKFQMESSSLGISKHASRIALVVPIHHQITKKQRCICKFSVFSSNYEVFVC